MCKHSVLEDLSSDVHLSAVLVTSGRQAALTVARMAAMDTRL